MEEINGLTIVNSYSDHGYFLMELSNGEYLEIKADISSIYGDFSIEWESRIITNIDDYQKYLLNKITREEYDKICNEKMKKEKKEKLKREKEIELQLLAELQAKYNLSQ